jgi:hypothetical protein
VTERGVRGGSPGPPGRGGRGGPLLPGGREVRDEPGTDDPGGRLGPPSRFDGPDFGPFDRRSLFLGAAPDRSGRGVFNENSLLDKSIADLICQCPLLRLAQLLPQLDE